MRRLLVLVVLGVLLATLMPPVDAVQTLTVVWEENGGATASQWQHGKATFAPGTKILQVGFDRRGCLDGVHGAMVFDDWTARTPVGVFSHRSVQYLETRDGGVYASVSAPVVGSVQVDRGTVSAPTGDCFWERSWMRFTTPMELRSFRFTVALRNATSSYAKAWIVADGPVAPTTLDLRSGDATFLVTGHDLAGGDQVRALASLRVGGSAVVPMAFGPTALLAWDTDVGSLRLLAPGGGVCRIDDAGVRLRSGPCALFEDGVGPGEWSVHADRDVGAFTPGALLWAGVDGSLSAV